MNYRSRKKLVALAVFLIITGIASVLRGLGDFERTDNAPAPEVASETTQASPSSSLNQMPKGQEVKVSRVIDGDTIEIETGQKVRYIGIDTPETVDPRRPVGCFGKEASEANKKIVEGKTVFLLKDVSETDKFGRLLRYVYLKDPSIFVNDYLVRQGYAKASTYPPDVQFDSQFLQAETEARANNRGLWNACI